MEPSQVVDAAARLLRPGSMIRGGAAALVVAFAATLAAAGPSDEGAGTGWPEPPGEIRFEASNLIATADGVFHRWRITSFEVDPRNPLAGELRIEVDLASLDTGVDRRDDHLRNEDFFEVERFPTATVRVYDVRPAESDEGELYRAAFDLDIHGVTRTVEGSFEILSTSPLEVKGELPLQRMDFEIGSPPRFWNPVSVRDDVLVSFTASLPKPS